VNFRLTVRGLTVAVVVITLATIGIGAATAATSTAAFCGLCKSHEPYIEETRDSDHASVNCEQCHTKPGPFLFLTAKLEALEQPVKQVAGYEEPMLGTVMNQSCRRCHTNDDLFGLISSSGINVQHRHLIEAGFLCIRCHSTVGHGDAVPEGAQHEPTMSQCLLCHNNKYVSSEGEVATADCELCHTKRFYAAAPVSHEETVWEEQHGSIGILSTCSACHHDAQTADLDLPDTGAPSCRECHDGLLMPHPKTWLRVHGARSEQLGEKTCATCHDAEEYCGTCHQLAMPHPAGFVASHAEEAERIGTGCLNCHRADNCQACHGEHRDGAPQAHQLFEGVEYEPPPEPLAEPGTTIRR
jgi:nitrate/TMAO reductase-like tetraheme cytochrome c subunit